MGVEIKNISMQFGDFIALDNINMSIKTGDFFSILGPSGCGKTTLLNIISGFLEPSAGEVSISGEAMNGISANKRPTSLVFQNLALFPNMSVYENIAFGLHVKKLSTKDIEAKVMSLLEMVSLKDYKNSNVSELSGGQKQRVAIARALAVEPKVLLLDEPLSALDLKLRQHMRKELRSLQKLTGITFIYITHDQGEALSMSDQIAVMSGGKIEQISSPSELYDNPKTPFVASFVGENNAFEGTIIESNSDFANVQTVYGNIKTNPSFNVGEKVKLFIRPERFSLTPIGYKSQRQRDNQLNLQLETSSFEGANLNIYLNRHPKDPIEGEIIIHKKNNEQIGPKLQGDLSVYFDAHDVIVLKG